MPQRGPLRMLATPPLLQRRNTYMVGWIRLMPTRALAASFGVVSGWAVGSESCKHRERDHPDAPPSLRFRLGSTDEHGHDSLDMKTTQRLIVRLAVAATLLTFIVTRSDFGGLALRWDGHLVIGLGVTVVLIITGQAVAAQRWRLVIADPLLSWRYLFRLYLVGAFFSLFLPTSVGGDGVRSLALARTGRFKDGAVTGILVDRALGIMAMRGYLLMGLALGPVFLGSQLRWPFPSWALTVSIGVVVLGVVALVVWKRHGAVVHRAACEARMVLTRFFRSPARVLSTVALSFVVQGAYIAAWATLASSLGLAIPLAAFLVGVPLVSLGAMAPITVSGLGIREGLWVILLAPYGIAAANAVGFSLLFFLSLMLVGSLGGGIFAVAGIAPPNAPGTPTTRDEPTPTAYHGALP